MINATYASFAIRPKPFDGIGMAVAQNVNLFCVGNGIMLISHRWKSFINSILIGVNHCFSGDIFTDYRENCFTLSVGNSADFEFPISFNNTKYSSFAFRPTSAFSLAPTTEITFINFDFASKWTVVFIKALSNLLAHSPSSLISNARFPLNLFSRDTATSLRHQVNYIKPSGQGCSGLVENCVSGRADLVSTEIASVRLTPTYPMKQSILFTLRAINSLRVFLIANIIKAYIVIWEHLKELFEREFFHWRFIFLSFLSHFSSALLDVMVFICTNSIADLLLVVKGYSPNIITTFFNYVSLCYPFV